MPKSACRRPPGTRRPAARPGSGASRGRCTRARPRRAGRRTPASGIPSVYRYRRYAQCLLVFWAYWSFWEAYGNSHTRNRAILIYRRMRSRRRRDPTQASSADRETCRRPASGEHIQTSCIASSLANDLLRTPAAAYCASENSMPSYRSTNKIYIVAGTIEVAGDAFEPGQLLVLRPGDAITVAARSGARFMLFGGAPMEGPRYIWWNFVSSRPERIAAAKEEWARGRFDTVPGDEAAVHPAARSAGRPAARRGRRALPVSAHLAAEPDPRDRRPAPASAWAASRQPSRIRPSARCRRLRSWRTGLCEVLAPAQEAA